MSQQPKAEIFVEARLHDARTDQDSQEQYEAVYKAGDISQSDSFYLWILDLLQLQPTDVYLDVSCGRAELTQLAQARGVQAHGTDLSHNALAAGQRLFGSRNLATANSQQLPYASNRFTVISNIGSLEHYVDMATAVREMARVLHPNGRAIILVPNTFSLMTNIWIAFRQGKTSIDPYQPIQRYAARYEWQQLLEDNGLVVRRTLKYERERPRTRKDLMTYLQHPKQLVRLLLSPLIPLNLAWSFVFICTKRGESDWQHG